MKKWKRYRCWWLWIKLKHHMYCVSPWELLHRHTEIFWKLEIPNTHKTGNLNVLLDYYIIGVMFFDATKNSSRCRFVSRASLSGGWWLTSGGGARLAKKSSICKIWNQIRLHVPWSNMGQPMEWMTVAPVLRWLPLSMMAFGRAPVSSDTPSRRSNIFQLHQAIDDPVVPDP